MDNKYEVIQKIGEGSFGMVYKCFDRVTNEIVAVKMIPILDVLDGVPSSVMREISLLKELHHKNIVRLLDVTTTENSVCLAFEHLDLDLWKYIKRQRSAVRNTHWLKSFLYQILCGLHYCHSHKVIHRDLKPGNLLIDVQKNILKLADFGMARAVGVPLRTHTAGEGTVGYRAPEVLLGLTKYSTPVDVWAVGCIFVEMVNGTPLFPGLTEVEVLSQMFRVFGVPNEETWPGVTSLCGPDFDLSMFKTADFERLELADVVTGLELDGFDLLSKMLCMNPAARITTSVALMHPYFNDVQSAP
ncbi:cell division control protein 2 homolog [Malania oleifera]|uniref:cell division control protein 2 homolog n=1 Tax=Malania oleifera TaxID=397392 RepID=UPI0025AE27EB|nr:cell division control protein 2 homolog [Malania oleifera]XP_057947871.1 cell division control protein 2 homolog [Malania oleifera]XP_057947872.1 cell division control protein 2 homolog [Malania oleifera]XP_057947873.1 cell division control protein 2 homolog [Malania oleifera]XP_057947874.1 cell division control protein 2 homolog [Malania oleifera]